MNRPDDSLGEDADAPESLPPESLLVESLLVECLEHLDAGREAAVDAVCAEHPQHAEALRRRLERLRAGGLVKPRRREQIGPYRLLRELGAGGMGQVFLAEQREPVRRLVALKCIKAAFQDPTAIARFEAERQALAMMEHPGIARVHDAGTTDDGQPYFAMEYVEGLPITQFCDERRMGLVERLRLFATLCDAIHHAHQHGIIHRDLKPTNVLIHDVDGVPSPKVIDFGLAKAMRGPLTDRTLQTIAGQVLGTPAYMSPEQAAGAGHAIDVRTDVYALGVMLYELVAGVRPFDDRRLEQVGNLEMLRILREEEPPAPSSRVTTLGEADVDALARLRRTTAQGLPRSIRGELDWIAMKALAKDPNERYASVSEFAADLRRHLAGEAVLAGPPTTSYRLRKLVGRHRTAFAFGSLAALVGVAAVITIVSLGISARDNLRRFDRLADRRTIDELLKAAEYDLWPAHPAVVPALDTWLGRARSIATSERIAELDLEIAQLRARPVAEVTGNLRVLLDGLVELRDATDRLGRSGGVVDEVDARRRWAAGLWELSVDEHRPAWDDAIAEARQDFGVALEPIVGLTPLGRDRESGRLEFAVRTPGGRLPVRGTDGRVVLGDEADDPVLVLIEGGAAIQLGAQSADPAGARFDPLWSASEAPREVADLGPYLLSKFEITQAQWLRVMGTNPSHFQSKDLKARWLGVTSPLHPVEQVSWIDGARFCRRLGLEIPSQGQWEHAARGGTDSPWWTGSDRASVRGHANLADAALVRRYPLPVGIEADLDDRYPVHAPVGAFPANGFGLHDTIGNVWEWCRNATTPWPVDPAGVVEVQSWRGGSFIGDATRCRVTTRVEEAPINRRELLGLRPGLTLALR